MNKKLINNEQEYLDFIKHIENNEHADFILDLEKPIIYPCIVVYHLKTNYNGERNFCYAEIVELKDFQNKNIQPYHQRPTSKIFNHLIHEHNSGLGLIKFYTGQVFKHIKGENILEDDKLKDYCQNIINSYTKMKKAVDYGYNKCNEIFGEEKTIIKK